MTEAHPRLRGVDVHVHVALAHGERQQDHREPVARQQRTIRVERRLQQRRVPHRPSVHDHDDLVAVAAGEIGRARQPAHAHAVLRAIHGEEPRGDVVPPHGADAVAEVAGRGRRQNGPRVVGHAQGHVRMRQRELGEGAQARGQLRRRRLEELEPRGRVEEQVAHLDARAGVGRNLEALLDGAALTGQAQAPRAAPRAARQRESRDGADRRQRLAAEAERRDRLQILVVLELGGRVALERQRQLLRRHADAVVADADQRASAVAQVDGDGGGAGVERVLDQLLDGGGRTLDDLAGGDLVDQMVRQPADADQWPPSRCCHFASMFSASSGVRWARSRLASSATSGSGPGWAKRPS